MPPPHKDLIKKRNRDAVLKIIMSSVNIKTILTENQTFHSSKVDTKQGDSIVQWSAYLLPDPAVPGSIPSVPQKISDERIVDVAEVNQQCSLEKSGQWLENVDQTHLVLARGNLVLQKSLNKTQLTTSSKGLVGSAPR